MGVKDMEYGSPELDAAMSEQASEVDIDRAPTRQPTQSTKSRILGAALLALIAVVLLTAHGWQQAASPEITDKALVLAKATGCCSWNGMDCGHGGTWCQKGPDQCGQCKGKWGHFQDVCSIGHPPAPPLPDIPRYESDTDVKVKVLSYNLEWWATGGGAAPQVITSTSKHTPYDVMGFQECNNPWQVLWQAHIQHEYEAQHVNHGAAVDICIAWRNVTWKLLAVGDQWVSQDGSYGARYAMWVRLQHRKTKEILFFMNHHGPLPLNSGGTPGGPATASNLLGVIAKQAHKGDAVILVGDFNADGGSQTVRQLECKLSHVAWGDKYNGIDNVFANVEFSHIDNGHGQTLYGGNSDHNALNVVVALGGPETKKRSKDSAEDKKRSNYSTEDEKQSKNETSVDA